MKTLSKTVPTFICVKIKIGSQGEVFVKLQPKQKSRIGVDFVFPLSQEQQEQELPYQNLNEGEV